MDKTVIDHLRSRYGSTPHTFAHLLNEIEAIHLNYEKKFLLLDPANTMGIPEPSPKIDEFVNRSCPVFKRFEKFEEIVTAIA
jgi:hypothetical protein